MQTKIKITKKSKIGVAYIRESTEGQDKGFSPKNQERTIKKYADDNNIKIIEIYKDLISGTNALKRGSFQKMVSDAGQHKFEVILVFHTSRFARNREEASHYKKLLRKKLNIDVIFVTQHFDDSDTPSGFLNEGVNELFDEHYSVQLSFWMRTSLAEKRRQGYQLGNPPFGYKKKKLGFDKERNKTTYSKEWHIDKKEAEIVGKMFKMYASGKYSYADIAADINKTGVKTQLGNPFTYSSIKDFLGNKTYLGYLYSPRREFDLVIGRHKPIITQKMFDNVQEMIKERTHNHGRPVAPYRFYLLQGLIYCQNCVKYIKGKENNPKARLLPKMYCYTSKGALAYGCKFRKENKSCDQEGVRAKIIDDQVLSYMEGFVIPEDTIQHTLNKVRKLLEKVSTSSSSLEKLKKAKAKLERINVIFENEGYNINEYLSKSDAVKKEIRDYEKLGLSDDKGSLTIDERVKRAEKYLRDFSKFWESEIGDEEARNREKKAWIQMTIKRIWVKDKKVVAIEPHEEFKGLFVSNKEVLGQSPLVTFGSP